MKLIEIQNRIMSKVHTLKENENFDNLSEADVTAIKGVNFKALEDMSYNDLYILESYIDTAHNEILPNTVYDLISEISTFVERRLLDEGEDAERLRLNELGKFLEQLQEELKDWELRRMKEDAKAEKPVDVDMEKIVDSLSSIVDRLLVQYGGVKEQEKEMEESQSRITPDDPAKDVGLQPKAGDEGKPDVSELDSEGDGDLKEGDKDNLIPSDPDKDLGKQPVQGDKEKAGKDEKKPEIDTRSGDLKEGDKDNLIPSDPAQDFKKQPATGDKEKAGKEDDKPEIDTIKGDLNEEFEEMCGSDHDKKKKKIEETVDQILALFKEGGVKRALEDAVAKVAKKNNLSQSEEDKLMDAATNGKKATGKFAKMVSEIHKITGM